MSIVSYFIVTLQLLFIGLKLSNVITWSWWIVFSPFLSIPVFILLCIMLAVFINIFYEKKN